MSHTPGPLRAKGAHVVQDGYQSAVIATCRQATPLNTMIARANANLFAAAPDLLAACKSALPSLYWANTHGSRCDEDIAAIESAIAKAGVPS